MSTKSKATKQTVSKPLHLPDKLDVMVLAEDILAGKHKEFSEGALSLALIRLGYKWASCTPNLVIIDNGDAVKHYITDEHSANNIGSYLRGILVEPFLIKLSVSTKDKQEERWKIISSILNAVGGH